MKASFRSKYGPPTVLTIKEVSRPVPKDNEVLIRVYAASANRTDYHILTGRPFFMHLFTGFFKPKHSCTGTDFAGQIEAIGKDVRSFKVGDKVMGFGGVFGTGSHAEYLAFRESKDIITMPFNLNYEQAAACLEGAIYASADIMELRSTAGSKVLVYGATGAIGTANLQFLKYYGAQITAVCPGEHSELVRSLGADKVIDYKTEDFTKDKERYDLVIDAVGKISFLKCKKLLKKKGIYTSSNGMVNLFWALVTPLFGGKKVKFSGPKNIKEKMVFIRELIEKGAFRPVIDRVYPLEQIAEAFTYVGTGQKIGNVIITIDGP